MRGCILSLLLCFTTRDYILSHALGKHIEGLAILHCFSCRGRADILHAITAFPELSFVAAVFKIPFRLLVLPREIGFGAIIDKVEDGIAYVEKNDDDFCINTKGEKVECDY